MNGADVTQGRRPLLFEQFRPELLPHERCRGFGALPEREQRRYWDDLAAAEAARRGQQQAPDMVSS